MAPSPEQQSALSHIGVVTVSYGSGQHLAHCLETLREHCGDHIPVVVVDNKPDAENVSALAERFRARYIPLESNPGYGAGMNAGVSALGSDYDAYFFLNPDVHFVDDAITPLTRALNNESSIGAVGPTLLNEDGSVYPSARNLPSISTGVGHALFGKIWPSNPWSTAYKREGDYTHQRDAGSLSGAAVLVRASVFHEIGGFDEGYFMHFEDIDLGYRIGKAGYRNVFVPEAHVIHSGAHSTKKHAEAVERAIHASAVRFMRKRYAGFWNTPLRWSVVLGLKIRGALKIRSVRAASEAKA